MTAAYVDTSCVVAIALAERGHAALARRLEMFGTLFASNLLEAELRATFRREQVSHDGSVPAAISWVLPDRPMTAEMEMVLEAGALRGADLWHVACALYLSPDPRELTFLTLDAQQAEVARALGFRG